MTLVVSTCGSSGGDSIGSGVAAKRVATRCTAAARASSAAVGGAGGDGGSKASDSDASAARHRRARYRVTRDATSLRHVSPR